MRASTLVVGADGQIGRALVARLTRGGRRVLGTSRRGDDGGERIPLDLSADPDRWTLPEDLSVAFLCGAVTSLQACESDPARTARVNVDGTVRLAQLLGERGALVVFLSTNLVFDGSVPACRDDAPPSPRTEYGRQKAAAERGLLESMPDQVTIVRLSKVLCPGDALLGGWIAALRRGEAIHPFHDKVMAPVGLAPVLDVLEGVAGRRLLGICQVSASRDFSYAEAARALGRRLGTDPELIQPRASESAGLQASLAPRHTTLCTDRLERDLGFRAPEPSEALEEILA